MANKYTSAKATQKKNDSVINISSKSKKNVINSVKKINATTLICCLLFFAIAVIGGYFGCVALTKNDCFKMNTYANEEVDITIGGDSGVSDYEEQGAKCVSFGKEFECSIKYYYREDISFDQVEVEQVDETKEGIYYVVYTTNSLRYKTVTLIRNVIVLGEEN